MTGLEWTLALAGKWRARVLEGGHGTPVVFLHGSGDTAFVWKPVLTAMSSENRVCALDFVESRPTQKPDADGHLDADRDLVCAVLERFDGPVHLVGHSYGALLALRLALDHPGQLRSLCLAEPIAFGLLHDEQGRHCEGGAIAQTFEGFFAAWRRGDLTSALELIVDYWNGAGVWNAMGRPRQERLRAGAERFGAEVRCAYNDRTSEEELRAIAVPTLIVSGSDTTDEARQICAILARTIPRARGLQVDGAGHSPMRSHPELFAAALDELIRDAP